MVHNVAMCASLLTPEMADQASNQEHVGHRKTTEQRIAEQKRVAALRETFETTETSYNSHREGIKAARLLIDLYGENEEVRKIEATAAAEIARLNEARINQELEYRQAEQDMFLPDIQTYIDDEEVLNYIHNLDQGNAVLLLKPAATQLTQRFGHTPTASERAIVKQEILQRRAAQEQELKRLHERKLYIGAVRAAQDKRMGAVAAELARPAVREEVDKELTTGATAESLLERANAEIMPLENREVHRRRFLENTEKIQTLRQQKEQILTARQNAQATKDGTQIASQRSQLT